MKSEYKNIGDKGDCVIEECSEVIQAIIKIKRFGWLNHHPDRPHSDNLTELLDEIEDLIQCIGEYKYYIMHNILPNIEGTYDLPRHNH